MESDEINEYSLCSFVDFHPFSLPEEILFGSLRSTTRFTILETLGDGSSSTVYRCQDLDNKNREIALKCLKQSEFTKVLPKEVSREISILKNLDHENVIKLHEIITGTALNSLCLVLEYCHCSLARYIDRYPGEIPHSQIKSISGQMFKGLDYLHKNYIIHRDIKPTNLMITADGCLKIIDFGLGRRYIEQDKGNMTPNLVTMWYQPPEILLQAPTYGLGVDLWSAACCVAELFAKKPLLRGESELEQIVKIIDLIGSPTPNNWPGFTSCKIPKSIHLKNQPFSNLADTLRNYHGADSFNFLAELFVYDPSKRRSAGACLEHDWFEKAPFPTKVISIPPEVLGSTKPNMIKSA